MIGRSAVDCSNEVGLVLSAHGRVRTSARRISPRELELALRFGRCVHVGAAVLYVVGRRQLSRPKLPKTERRGLEALHVLCSPDETTLITAYRHRSLAGVRSAIRRRRRRRMSRRTLIRGRRRRASSR